MSRLAEFRIALTVGLTTLLIVVAYETKEYFGQHDLEAKVLGIVVSLVLGPSLAGTLSRLAFSLRGVRRLILGRAWVEGVWLMETYVGDELATCGVSRVYYQGKSDTLTVNIWFPHGVRGSGKAFSTSTEVLLRESDLLYMNYFTSSGSEGDTVGVAVGHFFPEEPGRVVSQYEGKVLYVGQQMPLVRQIGYRVHPEQIKEAKKDAKGDDWMERLVLTRCPNVLPAGDSRATLGNKARQ